MTTTNGRRRPPRVGGPPARRPGGQGGRQQPRRRAAATRPGGVRARGAAQRVARRRRAAIAWLGSLIVLAGVITAVVLATGSGSGSANNSAVRSAPGFTLQDTSGNTVSLASYRGRDVVLYFNEGVGCDACFYQMREFEQHAAQLTKAGVTILPIVMNAASQVRPELTAFGVRTPYLIDTTGAVTRAYGALGKGMHAGLPGHGFVLIDASGMQRWYGEYPSMYLPASGLLQQIRAHLGK